MKSFSPLFFLFALLALLSTVTAAVVVGLKDVSWPKGWTTTMTVSAEETDATVTASPGTTTVFREMDPGRMTKIASLVSQLQGQGRVSTATRNGTVLLMLPPLTVTRTPTVAEQAPPATLATTTRPAAMSLESRGIETVTRANGAVTVVDFPPPPDPRLPPSTTSYDSEGNVVGVKTYLGAYPGQTIEGLEKGFAAAEKINEAKMQACLRVAKIHADKGDWEYNDIHDCVPDGQKQWLSANDGNH